MKCKVCNTDLTENIKICGVCGAELIHEPEESSNRFVDISFKIPKFIYRIKFTLMGIILSPFLIALSAFVTFGGHGTYSLAKIFYPTSMFLTIFTGNVIGQLSVNIAYLQFFVYGLLLDVFGYFKLSKVIFLIIMTYHFSLTILSFVMTENF